MNRRFTLKAMAGAAALAIVAACAPMDSGDDIVDIAASNDDFSTLVAAVQAAGLVDTLKGDGPFTVFAPTNDAFAALDVVPTGDELVKVLLYHVLPGQISGSDIFETESIKKIKLTDRPWTLQRQKVKPLSINLPW